MFSARTSLPILITGLLAACGPSLDKGPKKQQPDANNASQNNTTANNTVGDTTTGNNTTNTTGTNNTIVMGDSCLDSPTSANFGNVLLQAATTRTLEFSNCGDTDVTLGEPVISNDFRVINSPTLIAAGGNGSMTIEFTGRELGSRTGQLQLQTSAGAITIELTANVVEESLAECADSVGRVAISGSQTTDTYTGPPGERVELTAALSSSNGSPIVAYEWTLTGRPAGSVARLTPNASVIDPALIPDLPGQYIVEVLAVVDGQPADCERGIVTVNAMAQDEDDVRVQLTWNTPDDSDQTDMLGTDLDLHYLDSVGTWDKAPHDVFWRNNDVDWGAKGTASVVRDDMDGAGPEEIIHSSPTTGTFKVGVYYYANNGFAHSDVNVKLFRGSTLLEERTYAGMNESDFLEVLNINVANNSITNVMNLTENWVWP